MTDETPDIVRHEAEVQHVSAEATCTDIEMAFAVTPSQTEAQLLRKIVDFAENNKIVLHGQPRIEWRCTMEVTGYRWPQDGQEHPSLELLKAAVERTPEGDVVTVVEQA
jgi:hypothetical protein